MADKADKADRRAARDRRWQTRLGRTDHNWSFWRVMVGEILTPVLAALLIAAAIMLGIIMNGGRVR